MSSWLKVLRYIVAIAILAAPAGAADTTLDDVREFVATQCPNGGTSRGNISFGGVTTRGGEDEEQQVISLTVTVECKAAEAQ